MDKKQFNEIMEAIRTGLADVDSRFDIIEEQLDQLERANAAAAAGHKTN